MIRQLHLAEGVPKVRIARQLGISRTTVSKALAPESPPTFQTPERPSAFDEFESRVRVLLAEFPTMPATVIARREVRRSLKRYLARQLFRQLNTVMG